MTAITRDLTDNPVSGYIAGLTSSRSKDVMFSSLKAVIATALGEDPREIDPMSVYEFPWGTIDPGKLKALRSALLEKYSKRSAARMFAAVRGVLGACFDQKLIDTDTWLRIQRVKGISVQAEQKAGRLVSDGEIHALAKVCAEDPGPAGARDDAMLGLGFTQGPRVSELIGFELEDYDRESGDLVIRNGKGGKTRTIRANNGTKASIDEWLELRGNEPGTLFCRINKGGKIKVAPLTKQALTKVINKRAEQAGVSSFKMHDLRRTFITNAWRVGIPGPMIQKIAGHSSLATTASYDRSGLEEALRSGERLHYPSQRRSDNGNGRTG